MKEISTNTKFTICYVVITLLVVLSAGLAWKAHDLQRTVDARPVQAPEVAAAVKTAVTKAYKSTNSGILVNSVTCVKTKTVTVYSCEVQIGNAAGQTATSKFNITWTQDAGITKAVKV